MDQKFWEARLHDIGVGSGRKESAVEYILFLDTP